MVLPRPDGTRTGHNRPALGRVRKVGAIDTLTKHCLKSHGSLTVASGLTESGLVVFMSAQTSGHNTIWRAWTGPSGHHLLRCTSICTW